METEQILETIRERIVSGDRKGAEDFLVEHFKELPKELQGDLLIEFITDAGSKNKLENAAADVGDMAMKVVDLIEKKEQELKASGAE